MGSKVSSKMATPAARVIQAVRPHTPLIKFPKRQDMARPNGEYKKVIDLDEGTQPKKRAHDDETVQEALKTLALSFSPHEAPGYPLAAAPPPLSRPHVPLTPIPGMPDTLGSIQLLTARYRRRPLTVEEMDYIQRGGPE